MPTGAKLAGAVLFFAVGWFAAQQVLLVLPEGTVAPYLPIIIALVGLWQGWWVMGGRAGEGMGPAVANGFRVGVQVAFFSVLIFALITMFQRSARLTYDSPGEALFATMELFLEYTMISLTVEIWAILLVGGMIAGILTEFAARAWR